MLALLLIFLAALAVTSISIPWIRSAALALGFVDMPAQRKLHVAPMPLLGGVGIFGGAIIVLAIYFYDNSRILGILVAATLVAAVGLIDDRRALPPLVKFSGQALAFVIVIALGLRVQLPIPPVANYVLTFLWLAALSNAVNFLDNMDGLCAGVSGIAAAYIALLAALSGQFLVAPMAAAIFGACLGFLRYNFNPATIFMGDAGSLLLGFVLAVLTLQLRFPANSNLVTWMVPVFLVGLPLFDLALVTVSRLRRRVNPLTTAGKDHTSHRLTRVGFTVRETVLILYLMQAAFGLVSIFVTQAGILEGYLMGGAVALVALYFLVWFERHAPTPVVSG